jgi:hypothetical protein
MNISSFVITWRLGDPKVPSKLLWLCILIIMTIQKEGRNIKYLITDGQAVVLAAQCSYGSKLSGAEHLPGGIMRAATATEKSEE